jgi:hypothetical protein
MILSLTGNFGCLLFQFNAYFRLFDLDTSSILVRSSVSRRSLVFPATLLFTLFYWFDDNRFVMALPIGELCTFLIAAVYFLRFKSEEVIVELESALVTECSS